MSPELRTALIAFLLVTSTLFVVAAGSFPVEGDSILCIFGGLSGPWHCMTMGPDLVSRLFSPLGLPWGDPFMSVDRPADPFTPPAGTP